MRKILLTLAALAAFGIALPAVTGSARAETVIVKKHRNYGWHERHHDRVVVHEGYRHHHRATTTGAAVIVR